MKKKTKKKIFRFIYITLAVVFLLIGLYRYRNIFLPKDELLVGPLYVNYVIDGDTLLIDIDGKSEKVRTIGIDAPESVASEESNKVNTEEGLIASNRAKELLEHKYVYLEYGEDKYDQYGRILAYVFLEDKKTLFETVMLKEGLAKILIFEPNTKYEKELINSQTEAKNNKQGFWATGFYK